MAKPNKSKRDKYALEKNATIEEWAELMLQWGRDVRDDIIRLEAATGIALGDPGDPPPWPPDSGE